MSTETPLKFYFKGNFWSGGVIIDEYSVLQDENGDWWKYVGYRNKPFNVRAGEKPNTTSWVNVGALLASGVTEQDVTFAKGGTIENKNQFVLDEMTGMWYYWNGELPKEVPEGGNVETTGGVGSSAWMPIEGLISQNLSNIRALQQIVGDQATTIALLEDMQSNQNQMIESLQGGQSNQEKEHGNQTQAINQLNLKYTDLDTITKQQSESIEAMKPSMANLIGKVDSNTESTRILNQTVTTVVQNMGEQNNAILLQNEAISNQQKLVDEARELNKQQQDVIANQQQTISGLSSSQTAQDKRIDDNDAHDKEQDTRLDNHEQFLTSLQTKVGAVEKLSNDQNVTLADLSRRMASQESSGADVANSIKGQNDKITAVQQRLSDVDTTNATQSDDIQALKIKTAGNENTLATQGQQIQANTQSIISQGQQISAQGTKLDSQGQTLLAVQNNLSNQGQSLSNLQSNVGAWQTQANALNVSYSGLQTAVDGKYAIPKGSTTQYIRGDGTIADFPTLNKGTVTSVKAGNGLSGGEITGSGTIALADLGTPGTYVAVTTDAQGRVTAGRKRTFAYPVRSLNTAFQISTTQDACVNYTVDISVAALLIAGTSGRVILEYADTAAMTGATIVNESPNSISGVLNVSSVGPGNVHGWIPAGKYVRIRTVNVVGTPTFTFVRSEEVLH